MSQRQLIIPASMRSVYETVGYAPGVLVKDTLYISGQIGRDAQLQLVEAKEAQFHQVFKNMQAVLAEVGARFADIVDVTSYHTDMRDLPLYMKVRDQYFTDPNSAPCWTAIGAASLCGAPGYFLEVKATAVLSS
ncbi:RidA family protein [Nitrincola tapanii]|uniref:RidA family protein n=1 Tax=Nitrincola tapanii TaxID=1708751 RepID=A0A5A9W4S1_9GAMM|nr:RidA family protein [Nitrincola tapanii]KAA0875494.1 RidA family protein [Nitrincola tapanii]